MKTLYFDTETTGLRADYVMVGGNVYPGKICQLAYLVDDGGQRTCKNFYFSVEAIDPRAAEVTGLSVSLLAQLSNGRVFADDIDEIAADFGDADLLVAHNLAFDERFMRAEFARLGYRFEVRDRGRCTMRIFAPILRLPSERAAYKLPSLEELAVACEVRPQEILEQLQAWFGVQKDAHDARHDVVKMYLSVCHAAENSPSLGALFGR